MASPSQIDRWVEGASLDDDATTSGNNGFLSYNVFLIISVLGGFFGLDHLYLRSPKTFVAKFFVNLLCFGIWWVWDICQAVFNKAVVRLYGLSVPFMGPSGIAAGALADDNYDSKHWLFFVYGAALAFGGMFGLDSFLVGDNRTGLFRILMTITMIFAPISVLIWAYKMYLFVFETSEVREQYKNYFAGNGGSGGFPGIFDWIFGRETMKVVQKGMDIVGDVTGIVGKVGDTLKDTAAVLPAASIWRGVTTGALKEAMRKEETPLGPKQSGGGDDIKVLPYTLLGTILLIVGSGIYKNFIPSKKDSAKKDDSPPQPRTV